MNWGLPQRQPDRSWQQLVQTVRSAGGRGSFLLGFAETAPVFITEKELEAHVYIVGSSNSGKSSRVLAPLLEQIVFERRAAWVVDCKTDLLLLGNMRAAAASSKQKLHFFSLEPGLPSEFSIDFFTPLIDAGRSSRQIAELLVGSLGLHQSRESYFVTQNSSALRAAIEAARARGRVSFRAIAHELRGLIGDKRFEHCGQALDVVEGLADLPELNPGKGNPLPVLDIRELIRRGEPCYFCVPVTTELKVTAATCVSLLLKLTTLLSKQLVNEGERSKRIYFAIDEFQDVASSSDLKDLLAQVRGVGGGISLLLSHQVLEQVEDRGLQALLRSAGVMILLTPKEVARSLQEWSGEKEIWKRSEGYSESHSFLNGSSSSESINYGTEIRSALELDRVLDIHETDGAALVMLAGRRPMPVFFPHHIPRLEAKRREHIAAPQQSRVLKQSKRRTAAVLPLATKRHKTVMPEKKSTGKSEAKKGRAKPLAQAKETAKLAHEKSLDYRLQILASRILPASLISARKGRR